MEAGKLRQRVDLQRRTVSGGLDTWSTVATVWAAIEPLSGNRYLQATVPVNEVQGMIRIRYRSDILPEWRIRFGQRVFLITSIINVLQANRELQIMYREQL